MVWQISFCLFLMLITWPLQDLSCFGLGSIIRIKTVLILKLNQVRSWTNPIDKVGCDMGFWYIKTFSYMGIMWYYLTQEKDSMKWYISSNRVECSRMYLNYYTLKSIHKHLPSRNMPGSLWVCGNVLALTNQPLPTKIHMVTWHVFQLSRY